MHVDIFPCPLVQFGTANLFSEVGDANGIAGVQLLHQKVTAGLHHTVYLVHDGPIHNMQHTLLAHGNGGGVGKFNEALHYFGVDALNGDYLHTLLPEAHGEHGLEDWTGGGQHHLVGLKVGRGNVLIFDPQGDVTKLLTKAQLIHNVESLFGVILQGVAEGATAIV